MAGYIGAAGLILPDPGPCGSGKLGRACDSAIGGLTLPSQLVNRTFGVVVTATNASRVNDAALVASVAGSLRVQAVVLTEQVPDASLWVQHAIALAASVASCDPATVESAHVAWWRMFWSRSFVDVTQRAGLPPHENVAWNASAHYAWQRFLDAADGRGSETPIKFNGQAFTVDVGNGPDYRDWGGNVRWASVCIAACCS